jgi:NodT family efflux transporter outer membrane factor (OMF) lipoprotein
MTYIARVSVLAAAFSLSATAQLSAQSVAALDRTPASRATRDAPGDTRQAASRKAIGFWQALGDTTLERLLVEALRANRDVAAANARLSGARAERFGATLDLAPAITAVAGFSRQRFSSAAFPGSFDGALPDQDVWDAGLNLSWEIDVFGRVRRTVQGRGELVGAAQEDLKDQEVLVAAQLANAYFELRGAQDRLAVAQRNAENQRGTLDLTLQRIEAGRGTELDSERARAQLSATLAVIPTLEAAIAAAEHRIAVLAGRPPSSLAELDREAAPLPLPDPPALPHPDSVILSRPDVRSAERQLAASAAFVGVAKSDYLPRLSIGGTAGYTSGTFESLGSTGTPRYAIGPVLSWPALDLGRVKAGVDVARAAEAQARARYEQTVLRSIEEAETAITSYAKARERLRHLEDAAVASERAAELARLRFTEGASDFLQVLDAERSLLAAQDQLAQGRTEATLGLVALYRALGGAVPLPGR